MAEQDNYSSPNTSMNLLVKVRDIEERQRLIRDKLLLIGKNLVESREETERDLTKLKITTETMRQEITRIADILTSLSDELSETAKRSELIILEKQLKMFEPLGFARIKDVKELIRKSKSK